MKDINKDEKAFPSSYSFFGRKGEEEIIHTGMSLRDWFAGQALSGLTSNPNYNDIQYDVIAKEALEAADAILKEREKNQQNDKAKTLQRTRKS